MKRGLDEPEKMKKSNPIYTWDMGMRMAKQETKEIVRIDQEKNIVSSGEWFDFYSKGNRKPLKVLSR